MNEIFKLLGTIVIDIKDAKEALSKISEEAEETGKSADHIGDGFKKNGDATKSKLSEIAKKAGKTTDEVKAEAEKLANSYKEAGMDSASAMKKAYSDIEASADKSGKGAKQSGSNITAAFKKISKAGAAVVAAIVAISKAMEALADNTREYRLEVGKLETAFSSAGHTTQEATETYQTLYSVLGETDRAVEASQHIAKLCANEEQMNAMTKACIGAFALFDDSLPIEGLMEASNETAKTGQLTGVLVDALNWAGSSEEEFQEKLNACNDERERTALIIDELNRLYSDSADAYMENNEAIIEATKAQEKLNAAYAKWGEMAEPIVTAFRNGWAAIVGTMADVINPTTAASTALEGAFETSEQAAEAVASYKKQLQDLDDVHKFSGWSYEALRQQRSLLAYLAEAESQYNKLAEAEQKAADGADELGASEQKVAESRAKFAEITEQYVSDSQSLFERFAETYDSMYNKVDNFFKPFEKASVTVRTSVDTMMTAMQSQVEFNNAYNANLQALKEYGLGGLADAFQSYGAEGSAYAQAIVEAVEKAGGAYSEAGQEIIQGLADANQQVEESESELAETMALMNGEFESELKDMRESYEDSIKFLNKSAEATEAAQATFDGFLQGMTDAYPEIEGKLTSFGQQITAALQEGIGNITIPITMQDFLSIPGHETGLNYVPYDNYLAFLHKGEAVLTKQEASAWRNGNGTEADGNNGDSGSGGVTVIQNIEAVAQTPAELASATAAYFEQARWVT